MAGRWEYLAAAGVAVIALAVGGAYMMADSAAPVLAIDSRVPELDVDTGTPVTPEAEELPSNLEQGSTTTTAPQLPQGDPAAPGQPADAAEAASGPTSGQPATPDSGDNQVVTSTTVAPVPPHTFIRQECRWWPPPYEQPPCGGWSPGECPATHSGGEVTNHYSDGTETWGCPR